MALRVMVAFIRNAMLTINPGVSTPLSNKRLPSLSTDIVYAQYVSIAEFYSRNLATEVLKGMTTKAKGGGTVSRAPLGYINVRKTDEMGREYRTVELDEERAPLMKMAFELYATGEWTVSALGEHLATLGLTTRATPNIPSKIMDKGTLNKLLVRPYYMGLISALAGQA